MIVATPREGERLLGLSLLPSEISAMDEGALFLFNEPRLKNETVRLDTGETVSLPVVQSSESVANHSTWSGLITQKTADDLKLSSGQVTWVYPGVSETQLRALAETPSVLAFDPRWMIAYEPPAVRTEPPVTLFIGFSAGLLASLLVAYYSSAITRNLRPTLAALQSVGVRPTWLTIVTMVQVGVVILTAVLFAWLGLAWSDRRYSPVYANVDHQCATPHSLDFSGCTARHSRRRSARLPTLLNEATHL